MRLYHFLSDVKQVGKLTKKISNLPDSYIQRAMEQVEWKTPRGYPWYQKRTVGRKKYFFDADRPWSIDFKLRNEIGKHNKPYVLEPVKDWSFFIGDRVEVLVGKDKGKQGFVVEIFEERNWVIVEGLNCKLKKQEAAGKTFHLQEEQPLLVTREISHVDPVDLKPCKTEWRYTESGEKVRVSMRSGRIIPMPKKAEATVDYKAPSLYIDGEKDTPSAEMVKITFEPALKTFEMEIMEEMGIQEDRVPAPSYWY
ncbi:unnamed protein product [Bemisia tabaci]|uniref:Large ribosomal subunit protein uL24m n=1 Tax=Bemisia tabaci TaxID=7038 RepID=A0A9P0EYN8_BEMTA|nr:unnamed protein product [Bemisia tabaci]